MIIDDKITDQKLQYDTNMLTKVSALSSGIIDKQEYQDRVLQQAKFAYFPLGNKQKRLKTKKENK